MTTLLCIIAHPDDETMLCGGCGTEFCANWADV
jgi:LmbE family N-acetylglucosaminyl deacetylase